MTKFALMYIIVLILLIFQKAQGNFFNINNPNLCPASSHLPCDNGLCILKTGWCDGSYDCRDRSDELYCTGRDYGSSRRCLNHFKCEDGRCIPWAGRCDGYHSCSDGEDEDNCAFTSKSTICFSGCCVLPEKKCDGEADCANGLDELNCESPLSASTFERNRLLAVDWLKKQHDADWGWKQNTHRAVVALYLSQNINFNGPYKDDLVEKQLELDISTALLRTDKLSPNQLSMFINSLMAICHNPRKFYGYDLISSLKQELEKCKNYLHPLPYLTLCNAKEKISKDVVDRLFEILDDFSDLGFSLEVQAVTIIALSCITKDSQYTDLKENVTTAINMLKEQQREDGSFGNMYTTALVLQALIATDQINAKDWKIKTAVDYLKLRQNSTGSFGDFLTTYLTLPVLNAKSLLDISNMNCSSINLNKTKYGMLTDIQNMMGEKTPIKYSLFIGDEKDQIHPLVLRVPENITVLELMTLAADIDSKYNFKIHKVKGKTYVYEISGIPNDPEDSKFWLLYKDFGNGSVITSLQSPDEVTVNNMKDIIMWYKTPDSITI